MGYKGDDGRDYYKFRKMTVGTTRGTHHEHGATDQAKANADQFGALKDIVTKLEWTFAHNAKHVEELVPYWNGFIYLCTYLSIFHYFSWIDR